LSTCCLINHFKNDNLIPYGSPKLAHIQI